MRTSEAVNEDLKWDKVLGVKETNSFSSLAFDSQ